LLELRCSALLEPESWVVEFAGRPVVKEQVFDQVWVSLLVLGLLLIAGTRRCL
jgi:hypothetical protein